MLYKNIIEHDIWIENCVMLSFEDELRYFDKNDINEIVVNTLQMKNNLSTALVFKWNFEIWKIIWKVWKIIMMMESDGLIC